MMNSRFSSSNWRRANTRRQLLNTPEVMKPWLRSIQTWTRMTMPLWQRGCQMNVLKCLTVCTATFNEVADTGEYIFTVEFNTPDGSLFVFGACCGENPTTPPQS
jgi:hypothetical protein